LKYHQAKGFHCPSEFRLLFEIPTSQTLPLPVSEFFADFARVADDESRHLGWCMQRLEELGHAYGDMGAHNVLWDGAVATSLDLSARLAIVPCVQVRIKLFSFSAKLIRSTAIYETYAALCKTCTAYILLKLIDVIHSYCNRIPQNRSSR
jgi:hypothetical protein